MRSMFLLCLFFSTQSLVTGFGLPFRARRRVASIKMEDFGIFKGTELGYGDWWSKEPVISERKLEKYLNKEGYRYKMNKTEKEREGKQLFDFPEIDLELPMRIRVRIGPPQVSTVFEAMGFDSARDDLEKPASIKPQEYLESSSSTIDSQEEDKMTSSSSDDKTPLLLRS